MNAIDLLVKQFPGKVFISLTDAGAAIGYAAQTCYNLSHAGHFPVRITKRGRSSVVSLMDLATYIDKANTPVGDIDKEAVNSPTIAVSRRVGRPTKAEQIAARRAA